MRKFAAISLAGIMAFGALPVMAEETSTEEASTEAATEAGSEETESDQVENNWEPFAENVTLRVPVYDRGVEGVPDVTNNYWTQWIQENFGDKYNITVEYVPITRTDVMTSYALLAADQNLPTILMEYDYPKLSTWVNDGYLTSFDMDAFKEVAPNYYARMEADGQIPYTTIGDETYFALASNPNYNINYTWQTFVRMDWLKKVGYDHVPTKRDEYLDAMKKIQEAGLCEHPGGGTMITGLGSDQNHAYREYPFNELDWAMYGDYNIPALGTDANYNLLKRANEDYNNGITDPEYYLIDGETAKANFINGDAYSYGCYISSDMPVLTSFYETNPDAELAIYPVVTEDDTAADGITVTPAYRSNNPFGMMVGFSSSATEDELKAAWMYLEWMCNDDVLFTMQYGIEGENFNYNEDGLPVSVADYSGDYKQGYNSSGDYWSCETASKAAGTIEDVIYATTPHNLPQDFTQDVIDFYYARQEIAEKYAVADCLYASSMENTSEYQQTLVTLYKEARDTLTMCTPEEFDEKYQQYTDDFNDAGFADITEERKAAFEDGNTTRLPEAQKAAE